jgi:Fe-S-cluster-containing hydrogenase component 2
MEAIKENEGAMEVDLTRCIGCGLCISVCPTEAIRLIEKEQRKIPPKEFDELLSNMAKERGVA